MKKNLFIEIIDLKKYFSNYNKESRRITFYSESSIYYQYFESYINYILDNSDYSLSYVTSDPDDLIFSLNNTKIKTFYSRLLLPVITSGTDAKALIYTMPDLDTYQNIKRSKNNNVEHIYLFHAMMSSHMAYKKGAFDNYDTVFCVGEYHNKEIRRTEEIYNLKSKKLINSGYPYLENLYQKNNNLTDNNNILIAPSWHEGNIFENCIQDLVTSLLKANYEVIVRPHPELLKRNPKIVYSVEKHFKKNPNFKLETDLDNNFSIQKSALLITDWSGISFEYAFANERPVLFVNAKMKVQNNAYLKLNIDPLEIKVRKEIGKCIDIKDIFKINEYVKEILHNKQKYVKKIIACRKKYLYNWGNSSKVGGDYILSLLRKEK